MNRLSAASRRRRHQLRIDVFGNAYFGAEVARRLLRDDATVRDRTRARLPERVWALISPFPVGVPKVYYRVWGQLQHDWMTRTAVRLRRTIVLHWIGSDLQLAAGHAGPSPAEFVHFVEDPIAASELAQLGVSPRIVPLLGVHLPERTTVSRRQPGRLRVLFYCNGDRPDFYGWPIVQLIANSGMDVDISVIGRDLHLLDNVPPSVELLGWLEDLSAHIADWDVLLRPTAHDGLSVMVLQALASGLYVIWPRKMNGVSVANSPEEVSTTVRSLARLRRCGDLEPNWIGREVAEAYASQTVADRLFQALKLAVGHSQ